MTEREEEPFATLVRRAAPSERDPGFRLEVLARRETALFHRRSWLIVGLAAGVVVFALIAAVFRPVSLDALAVLFFGVVVSGACFVLSPWLLQRLPRLRR